MQPMTRLLSFWLFVLLGLIVVLQAVPGIGLYAFLMASSYSLVGILANAGLISLLVEAIIGRVPRVLLVFPLIAYGGYYAVYIKQTIDIARKQDELRAANPGKVLDFDANSQSLLTADARSLVQRYAIPVAYDPDEISKSEEHLSFRLIRRDQCKIRKDSQGRIQVHTMQSEYRFQNPPCVLRFPEVPRGKIVSATRTGGEETWRRNWSVTVQVTTLTVDGIVAGKYRSAWIWRLPVIPIPLQFGCIWVPVATGLQCGADFARTRVELDTVPTTIDRTKYDSPLSVMLGLKRYTMGDLAAFPGFAINDAALARITKEPDRIEDQVFGMLTNVLAGQNPKPLFNMGYSLSLHPDRLAPFAEQMTERLVALETATDSNVPNRRELADVLATALVSLPRPAFLRVVDRVFDLLEEVVLTPWGRFPALYVRAADAGPRTLDFYVRDFMTGERLKSRQNLPVLAICRVGKADERTIAEMKRRIARKSEYRNDEGIKSALFVALMKLGEESFLRKAVPDLPMHMRTWAYAVLANKGRTETGPNNCIGKDWTGYYGPMLVPSLLRRRGEWVAQISVR